MAEIKYKVKGEHDKSALNDLKSGLGGVESALTAAFSNPLVAITAATAAIVSATKAVVDFIASANEAEQNTIRLGTIQQLTFDKTKITLLELNKQISEISSKTLFDDDAVSQAQSALLVFDNINNTNFDKALKSAADLASFLGTDLKSAAEKLGKALNDPSQALSQLERSGITFTDAQEKMIKKMYETGDVAGAQKIIFDKLDSTIGGLAEKMGGGATASAVKFKQATDDLKESLGILAGITLSPLVDWLKKIVDSMNEAIAKKNELLNIQEGKQVNNYDAAIGAIDAKIKELEAQKIFALFGVLETDPAYASISEYFDDQIKKLRQQQSALQMQLHYSGQVASGMYNTTSQSTTSQSTSQAIAGAIDNVKYDLQGAIRQQREALIDGIQTIKTVFVDELKTVSYKKEISIKERPMEGNYGLLPDIGITGMIGDLLSAFEGALIGAVAKIENVTKILSFFATVASAVVDVIGDALNSALQPIVNLIVLLGSTIGQILLPVIRFLSPVIDALAKVMLFLYNKAIVPLANGIIFILNTIMALIGYIWNGIAAAINAALGWAGVRLGYMSIPGATSNFISEISPEGLGGGAQGGSGTSGIAASYTGAKTLNISINFNQSYVNGDARAIALMLRDEIRAAEALGY